ncbi:antibiotic biosynthesis monooxygenase family protein [Actinokineospora enzanensis]|uniref:antibiotic biosynthesis monooxygenase family protein n=1 Tax=Actinokineospora enzanensis TaxID=155975 RepID=UPI00037DC34E|nr:antibiotic biosynthesis monooxygenase [Actinokineospora enzanensis]
MAGELRVHVYLTTTDPAAVTDAYHTVSRRLAGVPGLLGNELLRSTVDPTAFAVVSRWSGQAAFREWEQGPGHRDATAPLRPFQDHRHGSPFGVFLVDASY